MTIISETPPQPPGSRGPALPERAARAWRHDVESLPATTMRPGDEELFELADFLPDALFVHRRGIIDYVNPAAVRILGYRSADELLGQNIAVRVIHPGDAAFVAQRIAALERTEVRNSATEVRMVRADGETVYMEALAARMTLRGEKRNVVVCRDVSERRERSQRIDALFALMGGLDRHSEVQVTQALRIARGALGTEIGIISRIEGDRYTVEYFHADGDGIEAGAIFDLGMTYCAITAQADSIISISQMSRSPHRSHPCFEAFHLESYIGAPLYVGGERFGTINFSSSAARSEPWSDQDERLVLILAEWTGRTLEALRAHQELERAHDELDRLARTDELTGLPNRRTLYEHLEREVRRVGRYGGALTVGVIDIDHFKRINDTYGHAEGDRTLQSLASTLESALRETDLVGRFGGEEFLVIMGQTCVDEGVRSLERLRTLVRESVVVDGAPVTFSAGVAELHPGECADELVVRADQALYVAKRDRDRVAAAVEVPSQETESP